MLKSLHIKNVVLIDEINLEFDSGYTSFTGETGAGKSIILTALGLVLGKKQEGNVIRFGADSAEVTAEFEPTETIAKILAENEIETDDLLIRRKITTDGKSKAFVNDTPVSQKLLAEIGRNLVEIHSQHEQSSLFDPVTQREIIDKFAGINLSELAAKYNEWKTVERELNERKAQINAAKQEEDYLKHVLEELSQLNPQPGEEQELNDTRRAMKDYEKVAGTLDAAENELTRDKNLETAILSAQRSLVRANNELFQPLIDALERASVEVAEVFAEIENLKNSAEEDPTRLDEIEARLFAIRGAARKYDKHPDQLADLVREIEEKLNLVALAENDLEELTSKIKALEGDYYKLAKTISEKRKKQALALQKSLISELKPLAMGATKFEVKFEEISATAQGIDKLTFFASTNPGIPLAALSEIASGGEISRFMLALKVVLLTASAAPTIIFDEIDTGTGGSVAAAIGERLARLGKELQVFVVTHLPQVAAAAQNHVKVEKLSGKAKNITSARKLKTAERKEELARMLAGAEITNEARAAAEKLVSL